jgi:hypothetical protein
VMVHAPEEKADEVLRGFMQDMGPQIEHALASARVEN